MLNRYHVNMIKNITKILFLYAVVQIGFVSLVQIFFHLSIYSIFVFAGVLVFWQGLLFVFLYSHTKDFFILGKNELLDGINLANKITLVRSSAIPTVAFLLYFIEVRNMHIVLASVLIFIFLTDTIDGQIARRRHEVTSIGQMLDSMSDYAIIAVISVAYWRRGILPWWFFYLIFIRLALQSVGVIFFLLLRYPLEVRSTLGGKLTIAATMMLYTLELIGLLFSTTPFLQNIVYAGEQVCALIVFAFIFEKAWLFARHWKQYRLKDAAADCNHAGNVSNEASKRNA